MPVIYAANWVLPVTAPPVPRGAVAIDRGLILDVGSRDELVRRYPRSELVDLGPSVLLPGLINVHSHLELTAFRGRLEEAHFQTWIRQLIQLKSERLRPDDLLAAARLGCCEAIRAGITTTADTSDADGPLEALIESGMRGIVFQETFGPDESQAGAALETLERRLDLHHERISKADAAARLGIGVSPHAPYSVSAGLFRMTARLAVERGLGMAIHTAESADESRLLLDGGGAFGESLRRRGIVFDPPGCSTVAYFDRLGVLEAAPLLIHCVTAGDADIELMARSRTRVAHCPKSNAKFGHGTARLAAFQSAGLRVGLGTDSVASNNNCDLIEEARFCALLHRAAGQDASLCAPGRMIEMMTIDGARALGLDHLTGSLEAGKQADLIAVRLDRAHNSPACDPATAIIFSSSGRDVVLTMVAGKILYDGQNVLTIDEAEVRERVAAIGL
ncbi:MAG: amidohydrolase family protein [Acidobacteriota bacterium]|nr:MAG: amidohydrolase family protein [Acidobacteriota bacterium]